MDKISYESNRRLEKQLNYIVEIDKVKSIIRRTPLFDGSRLENDGEHSWTICLMALLLEEYANFPVNIERVMTMLLIHDIVEIDAGDTFLYGPERNNIQNSEKDAAQRIFGLLEEDQKAHYLNIWQEYEDQQTNEAKFAFVFDRLQPLLQNYLNEGFSWKKNRVTYDMVIEKNKDMEKGSKEIWEFVLRVIDSAVEKGYLIRNL